MLAELPFDNEEEMLIDQIALLSVRERRLMRWIQKYSSAEKGQALHSVFRAEDKREFSTKEEEAEYKRLIQEKIDKGDRMPGHEYHINTTTEATYNIVQRFETELTRVQGKKTKCIEALNEIRKDRTPGDDGAEDRGVVVYLPDNGRGDS